MGQRLWVIDLDGTWLRADRIVQVSPKRDRQGGGFVVTATTSEAAGWHDDDERDPSTWVLMGCADHAAAQAAAIEIVQALAVYNHHVATLDFTTGEVTMRPLPGQW